MKVQRTTDPVLECVTLNELKSHLKTDSGSFSDNIDQSQSLAPDVRGAAIYNGTAVDVLGYTAVVVLNSGDHAAGGTNDVTIQEADAEAGPFTDWASGAFTQVAVDGMLTSSSLGIGAVNTAVATGAFTFFVAGAEYTKAAVAAGTAPGNDVIPVNKYGAVALDIGVDGTIDVIEAGGNAAGYNTADLAIAGIAGVGGGHVRIGTVTAMRTAGGFTFGTTALNDADSTVVYTDTTLTAVYDRIQEKAYTGAKQWIRTEAVVVGANCEFTTTVIRLTATTVEDDLLNDDIKAAREQIEDITSRQLLTATWEYYLDEFPAGDRIKLPFGNLQTTDLAVTYDEVDADGNKNTETLLLTTEYLIETNGEGCGFIVLPYGETWPSFTAWPVQPIKISFKCGWTTAALVPYKIKQACLLIAGDLYTNREAQIVSGQPYQNNKTVMRLLASSHLYDEFI